MTEYTNTKPFRTTTRARATAEAIRDRIPFDTSGSLSGESFDTPPKYLWSGRLAGDNLSALSADLYGVGIDYVVWSYATPIAWHCTDGSWFIVNQSFSPTTSKHQGNLYLIPRADHEVILVKSGAVGERWRVRCHTCNIDVSGHAYKADAYTAQHAHRINGRMPATAQR